MKAAIGILVAVITTLTPTVALGQNPDATGQVPPAPLPPATKLEAFKPAAGSVSTLGYDELGRISPGFTTSGLVVVELRELRASGESVRGMTVTVTESEFRREMAFVDADEIGDLLKGVDALMEVRQNPTTFEQFEVRYRTKGDLLLVAFNNTKGDVQYVVQAGRGVTAKRFMSLGDLQKVRAIFQTAANRLLGEE